MTTERTAARVGGGVRQDRRDQDVDEERGTVVGQLAQQHRVRKRQPDPDDAEYRHRDRGRDPIDRAAQRDCGKISGNVAASASVIE